MNCICGHSVFDHAKAYIVTHVEPWREGVGMFFHAVAGPSFTLSGRCEAFRNGSSYRGCGCHRFRKEPTLKEAQAWLNLSLAQIVESLPKGEYIAGHSRSTYPDLAWYRQFDRPQSAGRPETM